MNRVGRTQTSRPSENAKWRPQKVVKDGEWKKNEKGYQLILYRILERINTFDQIKDFIGYVSWHWAFHTTTFLWFYATIDFYIRKS